MFYILVVFACIPFNDAVRFSDNSIFANKLLLTAISFITGNVSNVFSDRVIPPP